MGKTIEEIVLEAAERAFPMPWDSCISRHCDVVIASAITTALREQGEPVDKRCGCRGDHWCVWRQASGWNESFPHQLLHADGSVEVLLPHEFRIEDGERYCPRCGYYLSPSGLAYPPWRLPLSEAEKAREAAEWLDGFTELTEQCGTADLIIPGPDGGAGTRCHITTLWALGTYARRQAEEGKDAASPRVSGPS